MHRGLHLWQLTVSVLVGAVLLTGCGSASGGSRTSTTASGRGGAPESTWPSPRDAASMVYDPTARRIVMYGGLPEGAVCPHGLSADARREWTATWLFDGQHWAQTDPTGPALPPPFETQMVYDPAMGSAVLVGLVGTGTNQITPHTWVYRDDRWTPLSIETPASSVWQTMTYDPTLGHVVLFDQNDAAWIFDGTHWQSSKSLSLPDGALQDLVALAFDPVSRRLIAVGSQFVDGARGSVLRFVMWTSDGRHWQETATHKSPPSLGTGGVMTIAEMVQAPKNRGLLLLGVRPQVSEHAAARARSLGILGETAGPDAFSTWLYNGSDWRQIQAPSPSPRTGESITYDARTSQVVLFGGKPYPPTGVGGYNDVWAFDGEGWTQVAANHAAQTNDRRCA